MERKHNPNNSGAGLQKVEIEMVRYYAKQARRGKTKKCKSKAKKKLVKGLQRVRKVKSLRKATTFRGVWEVTVSSGNGNSSSFFLHFSNVNEQNDFVSGTVENPLNNPTNTFGGWENLQTVRIATNAFNFYILNISGDTLSGTVQDSRFAGGSPVTGTRIMGP